MDRTLAGYYPQGRKKIGHNLATKQQQLMVTLHNRQKHLDNKTFR